VLELGVPERDGSGLVRLRTAATFESDRVVRGPAAGTLAARLGSVAW
jgi:pilus assembly protein CpaF